MFDREEKGSLDPLALPVQEVFPAQLVLMVLMAHLVTLDPEAPLAHPVAPVPLASLDLKVLLEIKEKRAMQDFLVYLENLDFKVPQDPPVCPV